VELPGRATAEQHHHAGERDEGGRRGQDVDGDVLDGPEPALGADGRRHLWTRRTQRRGGFGHRRQTVRVFCRNWHMANKRPPPRARSRCIELETDSNKLPFHCDAFACRTPKNRSHTINSSVSSDEIPRGKTQSAAIRCSRADAGDGAHEVLNHLTRGTRAEATMSSIGRYSVLSALKSLGPPTGKVFAIGNHHTTVATSASLGPIARDAATNRAEAVSYRADWSDEQ
jgi:hypothetical protein